MSFSLIQDQKVVKLDSGKSLYVEVTDGPSPDAPAIIFMHGLGSSTTFYQATLADSQLQSKYKLIRYDFDGHGLSPFSSASSASDGDRLSVDELVEDLKDVLDWAKVAKAAGVVGHSMSGLVGSTFAARYPDRVEKLVLLGAMKALSPQVQTVMLHRSDAVLSSGLSALVPQIVSGALSTHTKETSPLSAAIVRALVLPTKPEAYAAACRALAGASDPDYSKIKAQTLVVAGQEDYMSGKDTTKFFEEKIGGAKVVEMEKTGHWHAVERPLELRKVLEEFFL
ncbi:hypothetical protein JCM1841_003512 [Sporobolomyces salmonicolor]